MSFLEKILDKKLKRYSETEKHLKNFPLVSISGEQSIKLKQELMMRISSRREIKEETGFEKYIEKIKILAQAINPSEYFRVLLKEKLMIFAEYDRKRKLFRLRRVKFVFHWMQPRKVVAVVTMAVFVCTAFFGFAFDIEEVKAALFTELENVQGEVTVVRNVQEIPGIKGLRLKKDDVIRTGKDSRAAIRFLDSSMSRLDENGEVRISKLAANPRNNTETVVELVLNQGRLWSRVINLINKSSHFQVKAENTVAVVTKKAAFDVSVEPQGKIKVAKVSAIKNQVDVVVASSRTVTETTLIKGFTAEVKSNERSAVAQIKPEKIDTEKDTWITENLVEDEVYIEGVKEELHEQVRDQVKISPDNPLYSVKELSESVEIALTFDSLEKQKKLLIIAQEKLAEAQLLIEKGSYEKAAALLREFQDKIQKAFEWIQEHEEDPDKATEIEMKLQEILSMYKKQLALISPDDSLYEVKGIVAETETSVTPDPVKKTEQQMDQAAEKLIEAHDLAEKGEAAKAALQVEAYQEAVAQVADEVKALPLETKGEAVSVLLDAKTEGLKLLEAVAVPPVPVSEITEGTDVGASPLEISVSAAKTETLKHMGETILETQSGKTSFNVLQTLENINKKDLNGKALLNVQVSPNRVTIVSDKDYILVTPQAEEMRGAVEEQDEKAAAGGIVSADASENVGAVTEENMSTPPTADLKSQVLPRLQP